MKPDTIYEEKDALSEARQLPGVSIVMPFEPKMAIKRELEQKVQAAFDKVVNELLAEYPEQYCTAVTDRLRGVLRGLDYSTFKQSIAVFVSPAFEKVYYLDIPVVERVSIDENFEIRDLVNSKKESNRYLVLALNSYSSRIYLGGSGQLVRLAYHTPSHMMAYENNRPELASYLGDDSEQQQKLLDKFLQYVDNRLGVIIRVYNLPLFVIGDGAVIEAFHAKTQYGERIISYVPYPFEYITEAGVQEAVAPGVADWKLVKQRDLLNRVEAAQGQQRLAVGITEVWKEAAHRRGNLLVVEKKYRQVLNMTTEQATMVPYYIKDTVDEVIEQVLESGGDVELVDDGVLTGYQQIALIQDF